MARPPREERSRASPAAWAGTRFRVALTLDSRHCWSRSGAHSPGVAPGLILYLTAPQVPLLLEPAALARQEKAVMVEGEEESQEAGKGVASTPCPAPSQAIPSAWLGQRHRHRLHLVYCCNPYSPSSRPTPDCLNPPKGAARRTRRSSSPRPCRREGRWRSTSPS